MFNLKFSNKSSKFIKRLESKTKIRIKEKINSLCADPFPHNCVRVEQYGGYKIFRVRVGKYRILYSVHNNENLLVVINVDKRSGVYK